MPKKKDIMQFQRVRRYDAGVAAINAAANAGGIKTALAAHGKKLDLDMVAYTHLSESGRAVIDAAVLAGKSTADYAGRDAVAAVFYANLLENMAAELALNLVNEALSAERMAWALERHGDALGLELDEYNRLTKANKEAVCEEILVGDGDPYADESEVQGALDTEVATALLAQAVEAVNKAGDAKAIGAALVAYNDILDLDDDDSYTAYEALEAAGKAAVHAHVLANRPTPDGFVSAAAILTAFNNAVTAAGES